MITFTPEQTADLVHYMCDDKQIFAVLNENSNEASEVRDFIGGLCCLVCHGSYVAVQMCIINDGIENGLLDPMDPHEVY